MLTAFEVFVLYAVAVVGLLLLAVAAYLLYIITEQLLMVQNLLSNLGEDTHAMRTEVATIHAYLEDAYDRASRGAEK